MRDRSQSIKLKNPNELPSTIGIYERADDGSRTHTPLFARTDFKSAASADSGAMGIESVSTGGA